MELVRAAAHLPATTLEAVEAVFAERVTTTALFCASHQLTSSEPLEVGTRVELEVGTEDGVAAFVCQGVVGWLYPEDAVPPGREAGVGILVLEVIEGGERFSRMVARAGAGGRVRFPGVRVLQRLKIELRHGTGVPIAAPRDADVATPTPPLTPLPLRSRSDDTDSAPIGEAVTPPPPSSAADQTALIERVPALADGLSDGDDGLFDDSGDGDVFGAGPATARTTGFAGAASPAPTQPEDRADEHARAGGDDSAEASADESADESAEQDSATTRAPADDSADALFDDHPTGEGVRVPAVAVGAEEGAGSAGGPRGNDDEASVEADDDRAAADPSSPPPEVADAPADDDEDVDEAPELLDDQDVDELEELDDSDDDVAAVLHEPTLSFVDGDFVEDAPHADVGDRLQVLAAALKRLGGNAESTGLDGPTLDGDSGDGPSAASLSDGGAHVLTSGDVDLSALEELPLPPADGAVPPPLQGGPTGLILDLSDVSAFPEAPEPTGRPFEAQSTDVDLLASISAGDVIAVAPGDADTGAMTLPPQTDPFDRGATPAVSHQAPPSLRGLSFGPVAAPTGAPTTPPVELELLDAGGWPQEGADADHWRSVDTELFTNRGLPEPEGWPEWSDLLDARTMGIAFSVSPRGVSGLEYFAWPLRGSKRYSGIGQGESADPRRTRTAIVPMADLDDSLGDSAAAGDDEDVFSGTSSLPPPPAAVVDDDPFGGRTTDPRLNVEGLVARHVRASHADVTAVFDTPDLDDELGPPDLALDSLGAFADADVTRDEMVLPRPRPIAPTKALADPLSGTDSGEGLASSESSDEHP